MTDEARAKQAVSDYPYVSRETLERLERFNALLLHWNKAINLISKGDAERVWGRHIAESVGLYPVFESLQPPRAHVTWVDLGSGGGFPAIPLALVASAQGYKIDWRLIEADQRKAAFLREACAQLNLDVTVYASRIEKMRPQIADFVSARALAPLSQLLDFAMRIGRKGAACVFLKGSKLHGEMGAVAKRFSLRYQLLEHAHPNMPKYWWWRHYLVLDTSETTAGAPGAVKQPGVARIFAVANQKGGVGKTTTAINLGTALASLGRKILIIDLDPQGNASTGLGIERRDRAQSTYELLHGDVPLESAVVPAAEVLNLYVVPSTVKLSGADAELMREEDGRYRLRNALKHTREAGGSAHQFDYVLIDCPPSLNLLTVNALAAADAVLVPLQCEFFALEGLSQLLNTFQRVRKKLNPSLELQGVILTMFDKRHRSCEEVAEEAREFLGKLVYPTIVPRNVKIAEAPSHGQPVLIYDTACPGSEAYIRLAAEVLERENDSER